MIPADSTFPLYERVGDSWDWFTYEDIAASFELQSNTRGTIQILGEIIEAVDESEEPSTTEERLLKIIDEAGMAITIAESRLRKIRGGRA